MPVSSTTRCAENERFSGEVYKGNTDTAQAVGVVPAEGDKGGVTLITKKTAHPQRPGSSSHKVTFGGNKTTRKCVQFSRGAFEAAC